MVNVIAWPPVGTIGAEWTEIAPVGVSRSLITGGEYVSAAQRKRRVARLDVSALAKGRMGSGYMEALKRLLDGGVHLVRLWSTPIIWHLDHEAEKTWRPWEIAWTVPPDTIDWTVPPGVLSWFSNTPFAGVAGVDDDGWPQVTVSGLPPNRLVIRPGEFVGMGGDTAMAARPARSDGAGVAVIRLLTALAGSGDAHLGARETGVFAADDMPRAVQPVGRDWTYSWAFTEVFEDEGRGPFTEVDPWT